MRESTDNGGHSIFNLMKRNSLINGYLSNVSVSDCVRSTTCCCCNGCINDGDTQFDTFAKGHSHSVDW